MLIFNLWAILDKALEETVRENMDFMPQFRHLVE